MYFQPGFFTLKILLRSGSLKPRRLRSHARFSLMRDLITEASLMPPLFSRSPQAVYSTYREPLHTYWYASAVDYAAFHDDYIYDDFRWLSRWAARFLSDITFAIWLLFLLRRSKHFSLPLMTNSRCAWRFTTSFSPHFSAFLPHVADTIC